MKFILHTRSNPEVVSQWLSSKIDLKKRLPHQVVMPYYGKIWNDYFECRSRETASWVMRTIHKGSIHKDGDGSRVEIESGFGIVSIMYFLFFFIPSLGFALFMTADFLIHFSHYQIGGNSEVALMTSILIFLFLIPYLSFIQFYLKGRSDNRRLHLEMRLAFEDTKGEYE